MAKQPGARVRGSRTGRPIMVLLDVLGQRWTLRILWELREERLNFRELRRRCELDLVDHTDEGYGYTRLGAELGVHISGLNRWSERWAKALAKS
jgi:DNA-binding HxlR family transcriptional regulator